MNNKLPLVSVVIITYNSSKTIVETLESIKNQTYKNIELIISDDCSKDDTVITCKKWIEINKTKFINAEIIETPVNTGVAPNLNRGILNSKGKWIKILAGDDTLTTECIERFIHFVNENNCHICVSDLNLFSEEDINLNELRKTYDIHHNKLKENLNQQLNRIYKEYTIPGPGFFFSRWIYDLVKGFDEKYPFCEEWPFAYKILKKGYKFHACSEKLVNYRISSSSLCRERTENLVNYNLYTSIRNFYFDYLQKEMIKKGYILKVIDNYIQYKITDTQYKNNSNKKIVKYLILLSPLFYHRFFKTRIKRIISKLRSKI